MTFSVVRKLIFANNGMICNGGRTVFIVFSFRCNVSHPPTRNRRVGSAPLVPKGGTPVPALGGTPPTELSESRQPFEVVGTGRNPEPAIASGREPAARPGRFVGAVRGL